MAENPNLLITLLVACVPSVATFCLLGQRQHIGERASELIADIRLMSDKGIEYWELRVDDTASARRLEIELKGLSKRIWGHIEDLNSRWWGFHFRRNDLLKQFRQSILRSPFEQVDRVPDPKRYADIQSDAEELIQAIRKARRFF
ncbi:hypothetical protein [Hypericibacter terrae]|uniref:hypothetical protein n=1 Tax=Hypericibacter terrae TaxID=2602015 RepID=UPI0012450B39|nr:hypothetical protein [Hypericibacter terrae]